MDQQTYTESYKGKGPHLLKIHEEQIQFLVHSLQISL